MATKTLDKHIVVTPGVAGGKPRIAGHRVPVQDIAIWHERLGKSADEIAAEYELTMISKVVWPSSWHCGSPSPQS